MHQQFASDNNAGLCPTAIEALLRVNAEGHAPGYGDDAWSARAKARLRELFDSDCAVFFVASGTAANGLALGQLCRPYHAVVAHALSHVETDEAGACGFFSGGGRTISADTPLGKLTPEAVAALLGKGRGVHAVKPRALSLTQATELGTVYTPEELRELCDIARRHELKVHMDGARFANAVASLNCSPADLTWRAGVDVLCFGGVKNGLAIGEAVVFFDGKLAREFEWRVKQSGHLTAKMRFIAAPWLALIDNDVWLNNARHANAMARRLWQGIGGVKGVRLMAPVEANGVFLELSPRLQQRLRQQGWRFYTFLGDKGCRLLCSWDTTAEVVDRFAADLAAAAAQAEA